MTTETVYQKIQQHLPFGWFQPSRKRKGFGHDLIWGLASAVSELVELAQALIKQLFPYWASGWWLDQHLKAIGLRRLSGESDAIALKRYVQEWQPTRNIRVGLIQRFECLVNVLEFPSFDPAELQRPTWQYFNPFEQFIELERSLQPIFFGFSTFSQSINSLPLFNDSSLVYPFWRYSSPLQSEYNLDAKQQTRWLASPLLLVARSAQPGLAEISLCPDNAIITVVVKSNFSASRINLVQDEVFPLNHFSAGVLPLLSLDLADVKRKPLPYFDYQTSWRETYSTYLDIPLFLGEYRSRNLFSLIVYVEDLTKWEELMPSLSLLHEEAAKIVRSYPLTYIVLSFSQQSVDWSVDLKGVSYSPTLKTETRTEIVIPQPVGRLTILQNGSHFRNLSVNLPEETLIIRINHD